MARPQIISLLAVFAGACGPSVTAPSLEIRPAESVPVLLPAMTREPVVPADPALLNALGAQERMAAAGHARFVDERRHTESAIAAARAAPPGSESWTVAQLALSALETTRTRVRDAMQAVEGLRQDPANAGTGARAAVQATATRIGTWNDEEAAVMAALVARLR